MSTSAPHTAIFMGVTLAAPALGGRLLRTTIRNHNMLSGAAELFADALDLQASRLLADRFHAEHLTFQMAMSDGKLKDAARIAKKRLAAIISGISETTWPKVANEFVGIARRTSIHAQSAEEAMHAPEMIGAGPHAWRPEIIVHGKDPQRRAMGRAAIRRVFQLLLPIAINAKASSSEWLHRTHTSGFLSAPRMEFTFSSLAELNMDDAHVMPASERRLLGVKDASATMGVPHYHVAFDDEKALDAGYLAFGLLRVAASELQWSFRQRDYDWAEGAEEYLAKGNPKSRQIGLEEASLAPRHVRAAIPVYAALLRGEADLMIDEALREIKVSNDTRTHLSERLKSLSMRFNIKQQSHPNTPPRADIRFLPPKEDVLGRDFRSKAQLKIELVLSSEEIKSISTEDIWIYLARAYAIWMLNEESAVMRGVDLVGSFLEKYRPIGSVSVGGKSQMLTLSPRMDKGWANEFSRLVKFVGSISALRSNVSPERSFPGLAEIGYALMADTTTGLRDVVAPFHANLIDVDAQDKERNTLKIAVRSDRPGTAQVEIKLNFDTLPGGMAPFRLMEVLLNARSSALLQKVSAQGLRRLSWKWIPFASFGVRERFDVDWSNALSWIKLMDAYEQLVRSGSDKPGLDITGGGAREIADKLVPALRAVQITNSSLFVEAMNSHHRWIVETSPVMLRRYGMPDARRAASRMTVMTASQAKLIHFDGEPQFAANEWERLVEVILGAPDGITWVTSAGGWDSNRPELIVRAGEAKWYAMNDAYRGAPPREQAAYRKALRFVRGLAARYADQIGLPAPEPRMDGDEVKALRGRMMGLFHTDTAARDDHIDIEADKLGELIEAFKVLLKFHQ